MKIFLPVLLLLATSLQLLAQPANQPVEIPLVRSFFHEKVDETQKRLLRADWKDDSVFSPTQNEEINARLTHAATISVDSLQLQIEADKMTDSNDKIKLLRGLNECLEGYALGYRQKQLKPHILVNLVKAFGEAMVLEGRKESIEPILRKYNFDIGNLLTRSVAFSTNVGGVQNNDIVLVKYFIDYPETAMRQISMNYNLPSTDSLLTVIARKYPDDLYTYAASYNAFSNKIHSNQDSLVQIICKMSRMKAGRQYFPFIDNIYAGKNTFSQIDSSLKNEEKYYSLLVLTAIDYADRMRRRDTPISVDVLNSKLAFKAKEVYINEINGLHELPDNVRFRKIDKLSPQELYYLAVMGSEEIYTSSYVRGVYPRLWTSGIKKSDSLLMTVKFDHFKKFIKIAANYNTLDDFLKKMEKNNAEILMKAFINGLDKTANLEDAVDVADSYASIKDEALRKLIVNQVQYNLTQAKNTRNEKAGDIYSILNTLFLSIDSTNKIDLTAALGIPPVYFMPNTLMRDSSGGIVIEQYFYGDKDGINIFNAFLNNYRSGNWKISMNENWALVTSTSGVPIRIYSNRPLDEEKGLDAIAQQKLNEYLSEKDINPTMVIHRGHSYYLNSTLEQLAPSAKIILLGSCGGYQNLSSVLQTCPTAHIISSKQTGSGLINQPMINVIVENLRQGKDLNWPQLWKTFSNIFGNNDYFDDYVPPHKNLGAVFIMAYKIQQEKKEGV